MNEGVWDEQDPADMRPFRVFARSVFDKVTKANSSIFLHEKGTTDLGYIAAVEQALGSKGEGSDRSSGSYLRRNRAAEGD